MTVFLRFAVGLSAVVFLLIGLAWLFVPGVVAARFEMALLESVGRSTQIADLGSFFLTLGACMGLGLITNNRIWSLPAMMLLGFAASGRILAWLIHDAALALHMIAAEAALVMVLYVLYRRQ